MSNEINDTKRQIAYDFQNEGLTTQNLMETDGIIEITLAKEKEKWDGTVSWI